MHFFAQRSIDQFHVHDDVTQANNPYERKVLKGIVRENWIDTINGTLKTSFGILTLNRWRHQV
jgi:hypothetical protein